MFQFVETRVSDFALVQIHHFQAFCSIVGLLNEGSNYISTSVTDRVSF